MKDRPPVLNYAHPLATSKWWHHRVIWRTVRLFSWLVYACGAFCLTMFLTVLVLKLAGVARGESISLLFYHIGVTSAVTAAGIIGLMISSQFLEDSNS
jgi:hypothetical protein